MGFSEGGRGEFKDVVKIHLVKWKTAVRYKFVFG